MSACFIFLIQYSGAGCNPTQSAKLVPCDMYYAHVTVRIIVLLHACVHQVLRSCQETRNPLALFIVLFYLVVNILYFLCHDLSSLESRLAVTLHGAVNIFDPLVL